MMASKRLCYSSHVCVHKPFEPRGFCLGLILHGTIATRNRLHTWIMYELVTDWNDLETNPNQIK